VNNYGHLLSPTTDGGNFDLQLWHQTFRTRGAEVWSALHTRKWQARPSPVAHHLEIVLHAFAREIDRLHFERAPPQSLPIGATEHLVYFANGVALFLFSLGRGH